MKILHFQDNGQDLIEMTIDKDNRIVDSNRMQHLFKGYHVEPDSVRVGSQLRIIGRGYFRHPIEKIEQIEDPVVITEHDEDITI